MFAPTFDAHLGEKMLALRRQSASMEERWVEGRVCGQILQPCASLMGGDHRWYRGRHDFQPTGRGRFLDGGGVTGIYRLENLGFH